MIYYILTAAATAQNKKIMYTFIQKIDNEDYRPNPILAISNEIETLNIADTYDQFGQTVGHENAGDYHFDNSYSSACDDCAEAIIDHFKEVNSVTFDDYDVSTLYLKNGGEINSCDYDNFSDDEEYNKTLQLIIDINDFIENWRKENETFTKCEGFDYWNGHNWRTVVTAIDFGEAEYEIITENADKMNKAIENCKFIEETLGKEYYETEDFWIIRSAWQGDFESYQLFSKSDYDFEDLK